MYLDLLIRELTQTTESLFNGTFVPVPIAWLIIAGVLFIIELIHRAWLIVWFLLGALAAAVVAFFQPDAKALQIGVFFLATALPLGLFVGYRNRQEENLVPQPPVQPGRKAVVKERLDTKAGAGLISLDGVLFKARLKDGGGPVAQGEAVEVVSFDTDELTVIVRQID